MARAAGKNPSALRSLYRKMRRTLGNMRFGQVIENVRQAPTELPPETLWRLASRGFHGLISPIQNKQEILSLLGMVRELRPKVVMEIGTAQGGTLFMFSRVADRNARIVSLDLPHGPGGGGYGEKRIPLYQAFALKDQELELMRADSHDPKNLEKVKEWLKGQPIDFLFIDGDHSYAGAKQDFEMYGPLVRPGGIIAFHDIVYCADVERLWAEVKVGRKVEEFIGREGQVFGIGVVRVA
jgi:predicted O-methyltransferase YrrM